MRRVIKIGGSLLLRESFAESLDRWVGQQQAACETIAILGGGELIDAVRRLDDRFALRPEDIHWECVDLLNVTYRWLSGQLNGWRLCQTQDDFERLRRSPVSNGGGEPGENVRSLVAVDSFYRREIESPLPENWSTTTDAIAGWLSIVLDADELVLLKSCDTDPEAPLRRLSQDGIIDQALPALSDRLPPVRLVNFVKESDIGERST